MTWVDPESRDTGDLITAAIWNQDVVANAGWLKDNFPGAISAWVYSSSNISWPTGAFVTVTFDSELWDTSDIHSTVSNTNQLVAPQDGLYLIGATLSFSQPDPFRIRIIKNGSTRVGDSSGGGGISWSGGLVTIADMAEGDTLVVKGYHEEGTTRYMVSSDYTGISAWIVRIGAKPT